MAWALFCGGRREPAAQLSVAQGWRADTRGHKLDADYQQCPKRGGRYVFGDRCQQLRFRDEPAGLAAGEQHPRPVMLFDDFESNSAPAWNLFSGLTNGLPDYSVDWAFDYRASAYTFNGITNLIPPAPNSRADSTRGLKLTVNNNDGAAAIAAVNVYAKGQAISGNFALKFDLSINYPGNAGGGGATGSTEHAIFGINHSGAQVNWATPNAASSDGLWFGMDGKGGDTRDYRSYEGNLAGIH